jgi:adenosylcobinamide-phosphate synthase
MAEMERAAKNADPNVDPRATHTHAPGMLIATVPADVIFAILLLAFVLDAVFGDPDWLYRRLPHPVAWLGQIIEVGESRWNRGSARFWRGLLFVAMVVALTGTLGWGVERFCNLFPGGWMLEAVLASTLIAYRGLHDRVRDVAEALYQGLAAARTAVAHIVGRDTERLDAHGVARAAAESLAENFCDGVVAPMFWFALFGLPGLCAYKAVNTLDSMIGQRNPRFEHFGKAAARLDDALNWVPARLAGLIMVAAARFLPEARMRDAWRAVRRDAGRHRSPNAGWPEAALAGALGFRLAGPREYADGLVEDAWMGDGYAELDAAALRASLRLYRVAGGVVAGFLILGWVLGVL